MSEVITGIMEFIRNHLVIFILVALFFIISVYRKINAIQASLDNQNLFLEDQKLLLDEQKLSLEKQKSLLEEQNFTLIRMLNKIETIRLASDNRSPKSKTNKKRKPKVENEQEIVDNEQKIVE